MRPLNSMSGARESGGLEWLERDERQARLPISHTVSTRWWGLLGHRRAFMGSANELGRHCAASATPPRLLVFSSAQSDLGMYTSWGTLSRASNGNMRLQNRMGEALAQQWMRGRLGCRPSLPSCFDASTPTSAQGVDLSRLTTLRNMATEWLPCTRCQSAWICLCCPVSFAVSAALCIAELRPSDSIAFCKDADPMNKTSRRARRAP